MQCAKSITVNSLQIVGGLVLFAVIFNFKTKNNCSPKNCLVFGA